MKDERGVKVDKTFNKQVVGNLMYLTATRPNIMFVGSLISRYMENPTELHLQVAKRVLRYLKRTIEYGIFYKKGGHSTTRNLVFCVQSFYDQLILVIDSNFLR